MEDTVNEKGQNVSQCGHGTLNDHQATILRVLSGTGVGLGCHDTYKALLEIAKGIERVNNFEPYEGATGDFVVEVDHRQQAQEQVQAKQIPSGPVFLAAEPKLKM